MTQEEFLVQVDIPQMVAKYAKKIPVENEAGNMRGACYIFTSQDVYKMIKEIAVNIIDIETRERKAMLRLP